MVVHSTVDCIAKIIFKLSCTNKNKTTNFLAFLSMPLFFLEVFRELMECYDSFFDGVDLDWDIDWVPVVVGRGGEGWLDGANS